MISSANNHIYSLNELPITSIIKNVPMSPCDIWINSEKPLFDLDPESDFELIDYVSHPPVRMEVAN